MTPIKITDQFDTAQEVVDFIVNDLAGRGLRSELTTMDLLNAMADLGLELAMGDEARQELGRP